MLLDINKLNLSFFTDTGQRQAVAKQVLFDVSLTVKKGETVALVGESGSGKSVTALSVLRLLEDSSDVKCDGTISFAGKDVFSLNPEELRKIRGNQVAMIFQEPMTSLNPVYSIGNQLMEPLLLHRNMSKIQAAEEAIHLLERTGIPEASSRMKAFPHQLSGGQRQRVMIAMALACRPLLLIADEPTTALDVSIQAQILDLIQDLQQEFGMALLLITHDLGMVRTFSDHIHIMKDGRIVEHGKTESIFTNPKDPYTIHLMDSVPSSHKKANIGTDPLFQISNLSCHFQLKGSWNNFLKKNRKTIKAVDNVSLTINRGTTCGLIGESGSGKTTLGMSLLKLCDSSGKMLFNGLDLQTLSNKEMRPLRKNLQVVFQDPFSSLSPRLTVGQIIGEGMPIHNIGQSKAEREQIIRDVLLEVELDADSIHRYPHEFSGGQRQRIAIARSIVLRPDFLILDEPTSALDMTIQKQVISLLQSLQQKYNTTYLFISHDLRVIRAMADLVVVMQNGAIVESGASDTIFDAPKHPYTQKLFQAALS